MAKSRTSPLAGVRVIESSMLGPAAITTHLADMGADVIKVESPGGDYIRQMTWPIIQGTSLMHMHVNRGKKGLVLDLRNPAAVQTYLELAKVSDVVIEAMRAGALAKRGLGYEQLKAVNSKIVFCSISGYGGSGPYRDLPAHGIAFDTWGGLVKPAYDDEGYCYIPEHASMGMHAGPMFGALSILAGVIRARETGEGCEIELGQSDAAAYMDWYRIESWKAYERPETEVTGNKADNYERRAPGTAGMKEGVRYQMYESSDGHVLFMASEQAFWKNFCEGVDRMDMFEKWPGSKFADHARHNREMQSELRKIFKTKTSAGWIEFGNRCNTPIAPVNSPQSIVDDPQFKHRFPLYPVEGHGAEMLPYPVKFVGEELPEPSMAPETGEHSEAVLKSVLGYDDEKIAALRESGVFGEPR
jgi:crotonobetainyl-CoA:carnitine CoA-transferase CaiB-like acyl-CoA transferase